MDVPVKNDNDKKKGCFAITKVAFVPESEDESEMEEHPPDNGDSFDGSLLENIEEQKDEEKFLTKVNVQKHTDISTTADVELKKAFERSESTDTLRADDSSDAGQQEGKRGISNSRFKVFKLKSERGRWKCVDFFDDDKTVIIYETIKSKQAASPTLSLSPHSHISISQLTHSKNDIFFNSVHICSYCPHHSNSSTCYCNTFPTCLIPHSPNHPTSPTSFNLVHQPNKQPPNKILQHNSELKSPSPASQTNPNVRDSTHSSPSLEHTPNTLCDNHNLNSLTTTDNTLKHNDVCTTEQSSINTNLASILDQTTNINVANHTNTEVNEHTDTPSFNNSNTNIDSNANEATTPRNLTPNGYNQTKNSSIEISQKIARALDLAKAHLILTTQAEMELMRKRIGSLQSLVDILNHENHLLRDYIRVNDRPIANDELPSHNNPVIDAILAQSLPSHENIDQHLTATDMLCSLKNSNLPDGIVTNCEVNGDCNEDSDLRERGTYEDNMNVNSDNNNTNYDKSNNSKKGNNDLIQKIMNGLCEQTNATDIYNNNHNNNKNNKLNTKNDINLKEYDNLQNKINNNDTINNNHNNNNNINNKNNNNKVNEEGRQDNDSLFSNGYCSDEDDADDDDYGKDRRKIAKLKKDRKIKMNNILKTKKHNKIVTNTNNTEKSMVKTKDNCNHSCVHCCSNKIGNNNASINHHSINNLIVSNKKNVRNYPVNARVHHKSEE